MSFSAASKKFKEPCLTESNEAFSSVNSLVIPGLNAAPYPSKSHWGIDAYKFSFPINAYLSLPLDEQWVRKEGRNTREGFPTYFYRRVMPLGKDTLNVFVWETSQTCTIDYNPAHVVFGDTAELLAPELLATLVKAAIDANMLVPAFAMIDSEGTITWPDDWTKHISNQELEVAFNFEVEEVQKRSMQAILNTLPVPGNLRREINARAGSFTIEHLTKSVGKDMLYNKTMEMATRSKSSSACLSSTFRFESRLVSKRLDNLNLKHLNEVAAQRVWDAFLSRFRATGWSLELRSPASAISTLKSISPMKLFKVLGFSEAVRLGLDVNL